MRQSLDKYQNYYFTDMYNAYGVYYFITFKTVNGLQKDMDKFSGRTTVGNRVREGQRILNEDLVQKCFSLKQSFKQYLKVKWINTCIGF